MPHRFWNAGDDDLVCTGFARPPQGVEYFLTQLYASMRRHGGKRPGLFDTVYLLRRYSDEFGMLEIPAPVRCFVFPVVVAVGRLLGKHRRFADAPEPVRRGASPPVRRRYDAVVCDLLSVLGRARAPSTARPRSPRS